MAAEGLPVERLREYLRELPAGARALLIAELERAALRGDSFPGGNLLLDEVRSTLRDSGQSEARVHNTARLVFRPLDPFLVDGDPDRKFPCRLARASLEPIWRWIKRDLMPEDAARFEEDATRALAEGDEPACDHLTHGFQERLLARIRSVLAAVASNEKPRRRLIAQIGTHAALDDVHDLVAILSNRAALSLLATRLPSQIRNFAPPQIDSVTALLESPLGLPRELLPYALVLVLTRLDSRWQLVRLAINAAKSDHDTRIANTPYAAAVAHALADTERMVGDLRDDLERGMATAGIALLKSIHDAVRGLRSELDLAADSVWGRQLAAIRTEVSDLLTSELQSLPGRVRRLLRPRPAIDIPRNSRLDSGDVADVEAKIELLGLCRNYASELAVNEMALRTYQEVEQYLDTGKQGLLEALRNAGDADRSFRQSQVAAAARFGGKVFGKEYAALLTKAADVALGSERRVKA
jgi:hypothetical protein